MAWAGVSRRGGRHGRLPVVGGCTTYASTLNIDETIGYDYLKAIRQTPIFHPDVWLEGEVDNTVGKFFGATTGQQDDKVFDSAANGQFFRNDHDTRDGLLSLQPCIRIPGHRIDVMGDDDTVVSSSPGQHVWVIILYDVRLLHEESIKRGQTPL